MLDPAFLRPGRIDRMLYVGPPDDDARRAIFDLQLTKVPHVADVDLDGLVAMSHGYSGAE